MESPSRRTAPASSDLCVSILRARKFQLGHEWFANFCSIARRFAGDELHERTRIVMGADDKLHQRPEAPDRRRPENVQPGHGSFKAVREPRVSLMANDGAGKFWIEELVFGDVHPISGPNENVIEVSFAAVVEPDLDPLSFRGCRHHRASHMHG